MYNWNFFSCKKCVASFKVSANIGDTKQYWIDHLFNGYHPDCILSENNSLLKKRIKTKIITSVWDLTFYLHENEATLVAVEGHKIPMLYVQKEKPDCGQGESFTSLFGM